MDDLFNLSNNIFESDVKSENIIKERQYKLNNKKFNKFIKECNIIDLIDFDMSKIQKDKYIIYMIKNLNDIIYVGATININNRIKNHIKLLKNPKQNIHKYISDNLIYDIKFEILEYNLDLSEVKINEQYYINTFKYLGFNLKNVKLDGGEGII
jgi:hypothetical protein